ncbi:MAG: PstS family phosphate ABC transporter substrate-binding protein, partial [Planctomycetota bacterium]
MTEWRKGVVFGVGAIVLALASFAWVLSGCDAQGETIHVDGSSTVAPISTAVAEEFRNEDPSVRIPIGTSGTGGGFKRFIKGETDISNASRPIKKAEAQQLEQAGIEFIELPVAYDGLTFVVSKENNFIQQLTVDDLKKIFVDGSTATKWSDVREDWPAKDIRVFMPGTDSGTFDYFKEVVVGDGNVRGGPAFQTSEDDNVLVTGVKGSPDALGFFGCAYYFENRDTLRSVPIVNPENGAAVSPTKETIESGEYAPFSRPLFIYVKKSSLESSEAVKKFVSFYLESAGKLAEDVGYVRLPEAIVELSKTNAESLKTGSQFLDDKGERPMDLLAL